MPAYARRGLVSIPSKEAHVFSSSTPRTSSASASRRTAPSARCTTSAGVIGSGHAHDDTAYFDGIVEAPRAPPNGRDHRTCGPPRTPADELLWEKHAPRLQSRGDRRRAEWIHPDRIGESLRAHARSRFFMAADRMLPREAPAAQSQRPLRRRKVARLLRAARPPLHLLHRRSRSGSRGRPCWPRCG